MEEKDLKIVYYLGAGASYNSVPILNRQGASMIDVSDMISSIISNNKHGSHPKTKVLFHNSVLFDLAKKIKFYGQKALDYGSIDIYARRLHLLKDYDQLNELKYCLSVYFELWENFVHSAKNYNDSRTYDRIDKRYLSLLSVLLESSNSSPKLNNSVTFISWNYDLQIEMAYESFMNTERNSLFKINDNFNFMGLSSEERKIDVIHLNGYQGVVESDNEFHPIVNRESHLTIEDYLLGLLDFDMQFNPFSSGYKMQIKYAWEENSNTFDGAKKAMSEADVLIIIGYSFPSFNRKIDSELIKTFQNYSNNRVIYQDPNASQDIVNSIFINPDDVIVKRDIPQQFHIPHEFLFPEDIEELPSFGDPSSF